MFSAEDIQSRGNRVGDMDWKYCNNPVRVQGDYKESKAIGVAVWAVKKNCVDVVERTDYEENNVLHRLA